MAKKFPEYGWFESIYNLIFLLITLFSPVCINTLIPLFMQLPDTILKPFFSFDQALWQSRSISSFTEDTRKLPFPS